MVENSAASSVSLFVQKTTSLACAAILAAALFGSNVTTATADPTMVEQIEVSSRQITQFHIGRDTTRFGPLEFVGGLEMTSRGRNFGALSAMRFRSPGSDFIGVADTGFWFFGRLERDEDQRPTSIADIRMQQMVDEAGEPVFEKWLVDAEGQGNTAGVFVSIIGLTVIGIVAYAVVLWFERRCLHYIPKASVTTV